MPNTDTTTSSWFGLLGPVGEPRAEYAVDKRRVEYEEIQRTAGRADGKHPVRDRDFRRGDDLNAG